MKFKKVVSKILACAMVVTTVFTGNVTTADAAATLEPLAKYDFEAADGVSAGKYQDIQMITNDLQNYTGELDLLAGKDSEKALSTDGPGPQGGEGKYGMRLPQKSLGDEYTVSVWAKSSWGTLNSKGEKVWAVMSVGTADKNVTIKPINGSNGRSLLLFSNGTQVADSEMSGTGGYWMEWHMFTLTQSGGTITCYLDGQKKSQVTDADSLMKDDAGSIYIGVQQGGGGYATGQFDNISVYKSALDDEQVTELFTNGSVTDKRTPDAILDTKGITVSPEDGVLVKGDTLQVNAVLPAESVSAATVTYASSDVNVATVSSTGLVTAVAKGTAKITATATIGSVSKSAEASIVVKGSKEEILQETETIDVSKNLTLNVGGKDTVTVNLPSGLTKEDVNVSYAVSPDDGVVSVDAQTGEVTANKVGNANVITSVTLGDTTKTGITAVRVRSAADILKDEDITVTADIRINEGETAPIEVALPQGVSPDDATITYTSSDTKVATVDGTGVVTGVGAGKTTVTTTVTSKTDTTISKSAATTVRVIATQPNAALAVEYDFSLAQGGKLVDLSKHGNDAVIQGTNYSFAQMNGEDVMTLGTNTYVELPKSIVNAMTNKEKFTVEVRFAKSSNCGKNAWLFCFGATPKETGTNYLFLSPNAGSEGIIRSAIKNSETELTFTTAKKVGNDEFHTVNMVFDEGTVKLYLDGVLVKGDKDAYSIASGYSMEKDIIEANTTDTILGYIGKSCWSADPLYQGKISSFKIYNSVLTDADIQKDYQQAFQEEVTANLTLTADNLGSNASLENVTHDLSLPGTYNESPVEWTTDPAGMIAQDGKVYNDETADKNVKLTATVKSGSLTASKVFDVTVKKADRTALNAAITDAQAKLADAQNYTEASIETLRTALQEAQSQDVKGQTRIDSAASKLTKAVNGLVAAKGDHDPFDKIDESCYDQNITLQPTKSATVFRLPDTLKLGEDVTITYSSSNEDIATVDENGLVTANKKIGYTRIVTTVKAVYDGFEMEYQTLVKVNLDITKVKVSAKAAKLAKGKKTTIVVTPTADMKAAGFTVKYTPSSAVSVDKKGNVTAKKAGAGTVSVKVSSAGKSITRKVTINVGEITGKSSVKVKKSITLKVSGISGKVKWSLDKKGKKLATIKNGKLTAKKKGTVTVTAKAGGVTMTKKIKIN